MLKWYGYVGAVLLAFGNANFFLVIQPFADWYIPIVWFGYILLIDSIVYRTRGRSLIATHPKEAFFLATISLPFWLIFEGYNLVTHNWTYINYIWYIHLLDFTTIMPAVMETFMLVRAMGVFGKVKINFAHAIPLRADAPTQQAAHRIIMVLPALGVIAIMVPLLSRTLGMPFVWVGMFLLLDPLNYALGRDSIVRRASTGESRALLQMFLAGIIMGFLWEFWNYMAYPKWIYNIAGIRLFEMPLQGYLGYLPFALDVFLFYEFFRSYVFKGPNPVFDA